MSFSIIIFVIAIIFFVALYNKVKIHLKDFLEFSGIVLLLFLANILLAYIFVNHNITFIGIIESLLILPKFLILTSVGIYYLEKLNYTASFGVLRLNKKEFLESYPIGIIVGIILSCGSVLLLLFNNRPVINPVTSGALVIAMFIIYAILLAVAEETYLRLFIQPIINYYFGNNNFGYILSVLITSLIWIVLYYVFVGQNLLLMSHLFINGIVFGYLIKKKGFDSCVIAHTTFNIINLLLFSNSDYLIHF